MTVAVAITAVVVAFGVILYSQQTASQSLLLS